MTALIDMAGISAHGIDLDPWMLRHLLLSIDDRPRSPRDAAALEEAIRASCAALARIRGPVFGPPPDVALGDALVVGVPSWVMETNSWIFAPSGAGGDCVIVDVTPDVVPLVGLIEHYRLRPAVVLLTHGHLDHAGGVSQLRAALGRDVPVFIHAGDVDRLVEPVGADALIARALGLRPLARGAVGVVRDRECVRAGGLDIQVVHAPGHTAGTSCYSIAANGGQRPPVLFTGDQLFARGAGRCDLAGADDPLMHRSMTTIFETLSNDVVLLPGHGEATTMQRARRENSRLPSPVAAMR